MEKKLLQETAYVASPLTWYFVWTVDSEDDDDEHDDWQYEDGFKREGPLYLKVILKE